MDRGWEWSLLWRSDPKLEWMRERDAEDARRRLIRIAIISLILTPLFVLPSSSRAMTASEVPLLAGNLISCLLLSGSLIIFALYCERKIIAKYFFIEVFFWLMIGEFLVTIGIIYLTRDVSELTQMFKPSGGVYTPKITDSDKSALVAWVMTAFSSLALVFTTRGLTLPPKIYAIFIALWVVGSLADPNMSGNVRTIAVEALFGMIAISVNTQRFRTGAREYAALQAAELNQVSQDAFLSSILSSELREKVRRNERVADFFSNLTVIFADMVGFTSLSRRVSPGHLVDVLNEIFAAGDEIAVVAGIEKVKTIGDCYMGVAGGMASPGRGPADAIEFAQRYLRKVEEVSKRLDIPLALRVGIHTGPAVGGIIGTSRPAYDYWGETVNLASRLESASGAGRILVSESTWLQTKRDFDFEEGNDIEIKGMGSVRSHFVAHAVLDDNIVPLVQRSS